MNHPLSRLSAVAITTALALVAGALASLSPVAAPASAAPVPVAAAIAPLATATSTTPTTSGFDPGFIISDGVFYNPGSMSTASVQSFIEGKSASCVDYVSNGTTYTCLKNYRMDSATKSADVNCSGITGRDNETASSIIARVAKACGVNPQVLLVTLQKEQGFVTGGARSSLIYRKAMGYGCPDTSVCQSQYYGFYNQVYRAAWQFKQYRNFPSGRAFQAGKTAAIQYHPNTACKTKSVYIRNQATAGLYIYTPYTPNSAALAAGTGVGDSCSSYGNRNFYNYFKAWFGAPANLARNPSFESTPGTYLWEMGKNSSMIYRAYADQSAAHSGSKFIRMQAATAGDRIKQVIKYQTRVNRIYSAGIWVKSSVLGAHGNGKVILMAAGGGSTEESSTAFTTTDAWTFVSTDLTVRKSGHTEVRVVVQMDSVGASVRLDDGEFSVSGTAAPEQQPMTTNGLRNPGFESTPGTEYWTAADGGDVDFSGYASTSNAQAGSKYLRVLANSVGARVKQTLQFTTAVGEKYTAKAWVRSSGTTPVTGKLFVYAGGPSTESISQSFTVGPEWTQVSVTLPIRQAGHTDLKVVVESNTVGEWLRVDSTDLRLAPVVAEPVPTTPTPSPTPGKLVNPGFETLPGTPGWVAGIEGGLPIETYPSAEYAHSGSAYVRAKATAAGQRVKQTIALATTVGATYRGAIWVKAARDGETVSGELLVMAAGGGSTETVTVPFTVGSTYTQIVGQLPVKKAGHTELRIVVQVDTVGSYLRLDDAELAKQ